MKYQECNKIVKQKAFERAIASDEIKKSVVDSLDIESMSKFPVLFDKFMHKYLSAVLMCLNFICANEAEQYVACT